MLQQDVLDKLNEQINLEHYSSNLYLAMSSWCNSKGLDGASSFLKAHANEELGHMHKLFDYVNKTGSQALIQSIKEPQNNFKNIKDVFEQTYTHEQYITKKINTLVDFTLSQKDFSTFNFLQWYIEEQHEEEALFKSILDKINIIGITGQSLYVVDQQIGKMIQIKKH